MKCPICFASNIKPIQEDKDDYWLCSCGSYHKGFPYKCPLRDNNTILVPITKEFMDKFTGMERSNIMNTYFELRKLIARAEQNVVRKERLYDHNKKWRDKNPERYKALKRKWHENQKKKNDKNNLQL